MKHSQRALNEIYDKLGIARSNNDLVILSVALVILFVIVIL